MDSANKQVFYFTLDDRNWKVAFETNRSGVVVKEFTVDTEAWDASAEIFTGRRCPRFEESLDQLYEEFVESVKEFSKPGIAGSNLIKKTEGSILFEWWIEEKGVMTRHEWVKLVDTRSVSWSFSYMTTEVNGVEKLSKTWEKILSQINPSEEEDFALS